MAPHASSPLKHYYSVLGLSNDASPCAIRSAYKKLAMKWHPDKRRGEERAEAKDKFQMIQEAYAVLSDNCRELSDDTGLYNIKDDDDVVVGWSGFLEEMSDLMACARAENSGKATSFEELQQLFVTMFSADLAALNNRGHLHCASTIKKRRWGGVHHEYAASCQFGPYATSNDFMSLHAQYQANGAPSQYDSSMGIATCGQRKSKGTLHHGKLAAHGTSQGKW